MSWAQVCSFPHISGGAPASVYIKHLVSLWSPFRGWASRHSDGTRVLRGCHPSSAAPRSPSAPPRCLWGGSAFTVITAPATPVSTVIRKTPPPAATLTAEHGPCRGWAGARLLGMTPRFGTVSNIPRGLPQAGCPCPLQPTLPLAGIAVFPGDVWMFG